MLLIEIHVSPSSIRRAVDGAAGVSRDPHIVHSLTIGGETVLWLDEIWQEVGDVDLTRLVHLIVPDIIPH